VISADSHVIEPGDLWEKYVDPEYRDRAPHLVHDDEEDRFVIDGRATGSLGLMGGAGRAPEDVTSTGRFELDVPRASWDPRVRLEAVQRDGVEAEVLYPTICLSIFGNRDLPFVSACMDAYNRWLVDFCSVAPNRFKGVGLIVMNDIDMACGQLERICELGLSGVMVPLRPQTDVPYSSDIYDPVWARAQDLDLPVTMHIFTEPQRGSSGDMAQAFADWVTKPANIQRTIAEMIFSGVFERFPRLRIVSAENDIGWIAHFVARMDHRLTGKRFAMYHDPPLSLMPSEYFERNVLATFMDDPAGIVTRHLAGLNNLMWSSDYPHH
jgi:predicted TIM-barrel fold metal-dependent hydrolase